MRSCKNKLSTTSLRNDHKLIEKVLNALHATIVLLEDGKKIPDEILLPTIDFTQNFTNVCHHGKEEDVLFPALGKAGLPTSMGPIPRMLEEHKITKQLAEKITITSHSYLESGNSDELINSLKMYIEHVNEHLWKENNRLFIMADARLNYVATDIDKNLKDVENSKLSEIGKTREEYEKLVDNLEKSVAEI